jgi:hypothetical protein
MRDYIIANIVDGIKSYGYGDGLPFVEGKIKLEPKYDEPICMKDECEVDLLEGYKRNKGYLIDYKLTDLGHNYKIDRCNKGDIENGEIVSAIIDKDRFNRKFSEFLKSLF